MDQGKNTYETRKNCDVTGFDLGSQKVIKVSRFATASQEITVRTITGFYVYSIITYH